MADFPAVAAFPGPRPSVSAFAPHAGGPSNIGAPVSATWPAASTAYAIPFRLHRPHLLAAFWLHNGTAVSGNLDLGVYSAAWKRLASAGATAQAGTSVVQKVALGTPLWIGPGQFYMVAVLDNTTGTAFRSAPAIGALKALGMAQMAAAYPLPATITPASLATAHFPSLGLSFRSAP